MSNKKAAAGDKAELRRLERKMLGAPVVPPGRITGWASALRRRLLGLHRRSAPPPLQILEALFAPFDAHVLRVLVELDIVDTLTEPTPVAELADSIGCDAAKLHRVLRYAAGRGMIDMDRRGRVVPNALTAALRTDSAAPWRGWVCFATSDWFDHAWRELGPSLRPGSVGAFERAHGTDFFEYTTTRNEAAGEVFDQAMSAGLPCRRSALRALSIGSTSARSVMSVGELGPPSRPSSDIGLD